MNLPFGDTGFSGSGRSEGGRPFGWCRPARCFAVMPAKNGVLTVVLLLSAVVGCSRTPSGSGNVDEAIHSPAATVAGPWPSSNAVPADRLEWNQRTLLNAYNQVGARNSRWDNPARDALDAFAQLHCGTDTN